ncbi:insulin receptor substrate 2 [Betta splendens]|uniref:Insulin receptor substrate 2 n=1 Tax=Betta splendens TaxID=158456 RepID=A0A6P7LE35_BETSP|nr:insulin receptor substrate 2 [Betta splendens]
MLFSPHSPDTWRDALFIDRLRGKTNGRAAGSGSGGLKQERVVSSATRATGAARLAADDGRMASPPSTGEQPLSPGGAHASRIKKCGYLRKQKHGHKRFFVLKEPSDGSPARLEYYESEKKCKNKSAAKRVIPLDCCLNINKRADAKHKHLIALYTKDEYFAVAADNEQEQESWYRALADLLAEGKVSDGSASNSASSLVGFDEASYGVMTPVSAAYREVWQVNLKSKGLGQSRNLTGVYRLCLSSRTISFVKLNSEVASVVLQLMNIRRCGHSDSFFFIEVGRSAATGPGELWMQADDSVVAQSIHETILEAMKAMKELSEFRPRSKSQSSGTNPISVPTRRHLNHLPPSQTGLPRRSRTDSVATSPVSKISSCRIRTASEGDGTMTRPMSVTGSPLSPGVHRTLLSRSHTITTRPSRTFESSPLQHSKSMSMPLSPSPPTAAPSLVSLSSCPDGGAPRPSSCSASFSGSPTDAGFISCEEYGSSPADARDLRLPLTLRSNTPESLRADTPPSRDGSELDGYMVMERQHQNGHRRLSELDKAYRKRTYSLTTPRQHRGPPQVSSASLDEYTLMRATYTSGSQPFRRCHTASPKGTYPEDYRDVQMGSNSIQADSGYMPMMPGVAPQTPGSKEDPYMPMSPMCVSAPKQIINPRSHSSVGPVTSTDSPGSVSLEDSGYMRMWCGTKMSIESTDGKLANGEYLNMSPVDPLVSLTPPDFILSPLGGDPHPQHLHRQPYTYSSLPRSLKGALQRNGSTDTDQYVMMSLQRQRIEEEANYCAVCPGDSVSSSSPRTPGTPSSATSPLRMARIDGGLVHRSRLCRPTRLALESLRALPCMSEHPLPSEPRSPGEYINIDFSSATRDALASTAPTVSSTCAEREFLPLSDYANVDVNSPGRLGPQAQGSPHAGNVNGTSESPTFPLVNPQKGMQEIKEAEEVKTLNGHVEDKGVEEEYVLQQQVSLACQPAPVKEDYTEMTFSPAAPLPALCTTDAAPLPTSPTSCIKRLSLESSMEDEVPHVPVDSFLLGAPSLSVTLVDPHRGAKVIRADPQGRRRHSSETFSSTTTVTPVCPSFAHDTKRHSSASVENVSRTVRGSEGPDKDHSSSSPMCRETSAGYQNGLNYIALNLMEGNLGGCRVGGCDELLRFKAACGCKGGMNGFSSSPYASLGFKETAAAVKE